ncbi:GNAT family protein [Actinopolymorpha sp. B17G11]|uniref:GNAT family N-acetyltransferase n=1 Tax=Actinopolymorpha sp. B17G11 TaxID=3160861 RepID=UPI0032E4B58C
MRHWLVGTQEVGANDFAAVREVRTGSWVGRRHHRQGIATQMRAAVLHLAFAGLGAESARSEAFTDNPASLAVSRKFGYEPDGTSLRARRGVRATQQRLHLTRERWERFQTGPAGMPVWIDGREPCLPLFGLETATEPNG